MAGWCLAMSGPSPPPLRGLQPGPGPHMGTRSPVCSYLPHGLLRAERHRTRGRRREERVRPGAHCTSLGVGSLRAPRSVGTWAGGRHRTQLTHLPPGPPPEPPLSPGQQGPRRREKHTQSLVGRAGGRERLARTGARSPEPQPCLCGAPSSGLQGAPGPSLPGDLPLFLALRCVSTEGLASPALRVPELKKGDKILELRENTDPREKVGLAGARDLR